MDMRVYVWFVMLMNSIYFQIILPPAVLSKVTRCTTGSLRIQFVYLWINKITLNFEYYINRYSILFKIEILPPNACFA